MSSQKLLNNHVVYVTFVKTEIDKQRQESTDLQGKCVTEKIIAVINSHSFDINFSIIHVKSK